MSKIEKAKSDYSFFEKVLSYIPGYRGYKEKEIRRETDRLVRMQASDIMKSGYDKLTEAITSLTPVMTEYDRNLVDKVLVKFDTIRQQTERAVSGYADFFNVNKVKEDKLGQVIENDAELLNKAVEIKDFSEEISTSGSNTEQIRLNLQKILIKIDDIDKTLKNRKELLKYK